MAVTARGMDNVIGEIGDERFMIFWYTILVGWMVRREESVEKTVESAFAYEADVANLHGAIRGLWTRVPQGMTVRRIPACELPTKDVVVVHVHYWWSREARDTYCTAICENRLYTDRQLTIRGSQITSRTKLDIWEIHQPN